MNTRIAFWGTPALTTAYLDALAAAGMTPVVIVTNPDRPKGRGHAMAATPAKEWAVAHNIPVLQPEKLDESFRSAISSFNLDISIVVAYGKIITQELIDIPKYKTLNVHYSLLPKYRGAAPVEAAILAGETETGSSIQIMARALDSGPVIAEEKTAIGEAETAPELRSRLTEIGARLLVETLPRYIKGEITPIAQDDSLATKCGKIQKEDGLIDPEGDAVLNYRKYRAYKEWPRTYFFQNDRRVIITKAHRENGKFAVDQVLPEGKKEIPYADFLRNQKPAL